jgi:arylsulfatase A-like enzyme
VDGVPGWGPIPEDQDTLAEMLSEKGYRSALITDCYHLFKPSRNFHRGFDVFDWIRGQEVDRYRSGPAIADSEIEKHVNQVARDSKGLVEFLKMYKQNTLHRNTEDDYFPARVFRSAAKWYQDNQDAGKIFLVVDSFDPHEPWDPPENYRKMYDPDDDVIDLIQSPYCHWEDAMTPRELKRLQANYAGEVTLVDRWFGHFMTELKQGGRLDDTIVAVISDHGHNMGFGPSEKGMVGKQGHPMTHAVADLVFMLRHPSGVASGTVCDKLLYNIDVPATLLNLAGIEIDPDMDGMNFWPAVLDDSLTIRDYVVIGWGTNVTVVNDNWWYTANIFGEGEFLYQTNEDPLHKKNVAEQNRTVCMEMLNLAVNEVGGMVPKEFMEWSKKGNSRLFVFGTGEPYCTVQTLAKSSKDKISSRLQMLGY